MKIMRLVLCLIVFAGLFLFTRAEAWAKNDDPFPDDYRVAPVYEYMSRTILRKFPTSIDFMKFRSLYTQTRQYDPLGEDVFARMDALSYTATHDTDKEKSGRALLEYQALVADHLAHLGVMMKALSLAKQDKRLGNPAFFKWISGELINTVTTSGNGRSLSDAYDVITLTEETVLLRTLGLNLLHSVPKNEGFVYYNMDEVENPRTGEKWSVFVNTTIPMRFLENQKQSR